MRGVHRAPKTLDNLLIDLGVFRSARFNAGFAAQNLLFASFMGVTLVVPLTWKACAAARRLRRAWCCFRNRRRVLNLGGVLTDRIGARKCAW